MTSDQVLAALRAHKTVALAILVVVLAAAIVAGVLRPVTYTAQTRLNVGQGTITSQSIPGYATGVQSLASSYSRAIVARSVTEPLGQQLGLPTHVVERRLTASPIPESSVIVVQATGPSEAKAVDLANRGGAQLISYVTQQGSTTRDAEQLLTRFRQATVELVKASDRLDRLRRSGTSRRSIVGAQADVEAARLRSKTLSQSYSQLQEGVSTSSLLQVLTEASGASDDRNAQVERLGVTGLLAGGFLGLCAALALQRRRTTARTTTDRPVSV
jgi:uncharacterized protein involved in exopolysaccharide biosynthesis